MTCGASNVINIQAPRNTCSSKSQGWSLQKTSISLLRRRRGSWKQHDMLDGWPNSLRVEPLSSSSNWNLQCCEVDNTSCFLHRKWSNKLTQTTVQFFFGRLVKTMSKHASGVKKSVTCGFKCAVTAMLGGLLRGAGGRKWWKWWLCGH